jgi:hypothetical protein
MICRWVFCSLCLVPTLGTCGFIFYQRTPLHAASERAFWQGQICAHTGLTARVGKVRRPRHRRVLLEEVSLTDPDSGRKLARVRLVEMAWIDEGLVVLLSQPEIEVGQFQRLWNALHRRVVQAGPLPIPIQITAAELTLHARPSALTFTGVRCTTESSSKMTKTLIDFRVAGANMSSPAQLQILRSRQEFPPLTGWQLRTGATPLPCSLFADYCRPLKRLGSESLFQGTIWAQETERGWDGEIAGRFERVDLQSVIEPFPHKLSGSAQVVFSQAAFRHGRLEDVAGSVFANGGVISSSLIRELGKSLQLRLEPNFKVADKQLHRYDEMAIGFELDADGLRVSGLCDSAASGTLLRGPDGAMLSDSLEAVLPAVALARALSPEAQLQVPATRETHLLLRTLPLPSAQPSAPLTAERTYAPLRFKE